MLLGFVYLRDTEHTDLSTVQDQMRHQLCIEHLLCASMSHESNLHDFLMILSTKLACPLYTQRKVICSHDHDLGVARIQFWAWDSNLLATIQCSLQYSEVGESSYLVTLPILSIRHDVLCIPLIIIVCRKISCLLSSVSGRIKGFAFSSF